MKHPFDGIVVPKEEEKDKEKKAFNRRAVIKTAALAYPATLVACKSTNSRTLETSPGLEPSQPAPVNDGTQGHEGIATTLAVGEEGGDYATTQAVGEEGGDIFTTMAVGEEGGPALTTLALGEEGAEPITDINQEEGYGNIPDDSDDVFATTMAVGEEGGSHPIVTTQAVGEEGADQAPITKRYIGAENGGRVTTMALGEEGGFATTMAVGEEGGEGEVPVVTTMALGEEGADAPVVTLAVGEDGGTATSLSLDEEGGGGLDDDLRNPPITTNAEIPSETGAGFGFELRNPGNGSNPGTNPVPGPQPVPRPNPDIPTVTTMAVGEEGGFATTQAVGEEGGFATTQAVGEEGGDQRPFPEPRPTTLALGEEGGLTTQAVGEEGGSGRPPIVFTTQALYEEGAEATTLALGEEGGSAGDIRPFDVSPQGARPLGQPATLTYEDVLQQLGADNGDDLEAIMKAASSTGVSPMSTRALGAETASPSSVGTPDDNLITTMAVGEEGGGYGSSSRNVSWLSIAEVINNLSCSGYKLKFQFASYDGTLLKKERGSIYRKTMVMTAYISVQSDRRDFPEFFLKLVLRLASWQRPADLRNAINQRVQSVLRDDAIMSRVRLQCR